MTRVTSSTSWSFATPALNIAKLADDIAKAGNYINAPTANVPQSVKDQGEQAVKLYQAAILYGMGGDEVRAYLGSPEFQAHLRARESYQQLKRFTNDPEQLAFGLFFVMQGERVYFDPAVGKLKVPMDCSQNGAFAAPYGRPVQDLAQRIKNDPRGASALVSTYLADAVADYARLKGADAAARFDEISACASSWAMLTGDVQTLDLVTGMAPSSRASYMADYTQKLKTAIAANGSQPLMLDQLYAKLPNFVASDNGKIEDVTSDMFGVALLALPVIGPAIRAAGLGVRLIAVTGETVELSGATLAGDALLRFLADPNGIPSSFASRHSPASPNSGGMALLPRRRPETAGLPCQQRH